MHNGQDKSGWDRNRQDWMVQYWVRIDQTGMEGIRKYRRRQERNSIQENMDRIETLNRTEMEWIVQKCRSSKQNGLGINEEESIGYSDGK